LLLEILQTGGKHGGYGKNVAEKLSIAREAGEEAERSL
jgi:hypothetical protein